MDEILFKGKPIKEATEDVTTELYAYEAFPIKDGFVYGHLITGAQPYIVGPIEEVNNEYCSMEWWCPVIPETIGRYSGIDDKNGKKIFMGDCVRMRSGQVRLVEFAYGSFGYFCSDEPNDFMPFADLFKLGYTSDDFEIVGNIYDNPKLPEDKTNE